MPPSGLDEFQEVFSSFTAKLQGLEDSELILELYFSFLKRTDPLSFAVIRLQGSTLLEGVETQKGQPLSVKEFSHLQKDAPQWIGHRLGHLGIFSLPLFGKLFSGAVLSSENGNRLFILKTPKHHRLILDALTRVVQLRLELVLKNQQIKNLVHQDDLTGLYNVRYLGVALEQEIRRCERFHAPFCLMFIDLDNFKSINDRYGHLVGSHTLKEVGARIKKELREVDSVFRYGGDEFVVLLIASDSQNGSAVAERIRSVIASNPIVDQDHQFEISVSIGLACYPHDAQDKTELLKLADQGMYQSKRTGKNRVSNYLKQLDI